MGDQEFRGMKQHFVTFYSPGTFLAEETTKPIDSWDIEAAQEMAHGVVERYNAVPYGFRFSTHGRTDKDLDSKIIASSGLYHLGGKVETLEEIEARDDPKEEILRSNMRRNGYKRVVINDNSWRSTHALEDGDQILDWKPRAK